MSVDPIGALVAILLDDIAVSDRVQDRGFGGELPASEAGSMPRQALVVRPSGGVAMNGDSFVEHDTQRVDVFAYGGSPGEAGMLMADIALALRRVRRRVIVGTLVHWVQSAGGYSSGREPETNWPRVFQSFQLLYALERVS
ncbi:MAG: DUF3168 domain-containing protein [Sphingobium sp.]|jgi:hypothetical protein|nr:MAG: DUF3168 domain-containing protein [Sphingobium sp.]